MRILLVEDDELLASGLQRAFRQEGWSVDWLARGAGVVDAVLQGSFDVVVLDLGLPDVDGVEIISALRTRGLNVALLVLTARDAIPDRVTGLRAGADDYLAKPFALSELLARVVALARRSGMAPGQMLELGVLRMDRRAHRAWLHDQALLLTEREWTLLEVLLVDSERVVAKEELARHAGEEGDEASGNAIEVYIFRLRAKLADSGVRIRTVRGFGYMLERAPQA
jgi:DNA-binding response OmpR family regulator